MTARSRVAAVIAVAAVVLALATLLIGTHDPQFLSIALSFSAMGGLLGAQRPRNPIGWLFLGFGVVGAIGFATDNYAQHVYASDPGAFSGDLAAAVAAHIGHAGFGLFVFAFLLFPNGQLLTPRWRWVARAAGVTYGGLALSGPFDGDYLHEYLPQADPLFGGAVERVGSVVFGVCLLVNLLLLMVAAVSLGLRLHRARSDERQQVKWFATPVALVMLAFPISVFVAGDGRYGIWLFPLIPGSAAVAILRYRLYDIDVVINRALVYGALTVTLIAAYVGTVLLTELVLPARSDLGVALSTLAAAAVFMPARRRIQAAVDRRFFRHRYDAGRTLAAFGSRLRDEVDLRTLTADLRDVIAETVQPAHVSVWLRETDA